MADILITLFVFALAGLVVGVGVKLVRSFPALGAFLAQRPVLGWTAAFLLGGAAFSGTISLIEHVAFALLAK